MTAPRLPLGIRVRTALVSARVLRRRLGLFAALRVLVEVARAQARGEPFAALGPPGSDREALSREQAGPAILLWRALGRRLAADEAIDLTGEVVIAATVVFLGRTIGPLRRADYLGLPEGERLVRVERLGSRFFNATIRWDEISGEAVRFTVTACHFPRLCAAVGAEPVASLMCQGDELYFGSVVKSVKLRRSRTIAGGGADCPFELRWRE